MDKTVLYEQLWDAGAAGLVGSDDLLIGIAAKFVLTIVILHLDVFYQLLYRAFTRLRRMQINNTKPFPFEALPQELRDMVYRELLEDVYYPPPAASPPASPLNGMLASLWGSATNPRNTARAPKPSNWLFLANKQIYAEYMDTLCKHGTFHLTVSPQNYQPANNDTRIWPIAPTTFKHIRTASLQLITTSAMLGCADPRAMASASWALAARLRRELSALTACTRLTLNATAIGDPLWNPLWIWFHAAQSFKNIGTPLSSDQPLLGPRLHQITFSLDTWSPGENYLEREDAGRGAWTWYCMKGHKVGVDGGPEQTVREFCGMLYRECRTCRPVEEGEEGQEEKEE